MAQNFPGKLIPNMKITIGSETNQIEEGELTDTEDAENISVDDAENISSNKEEGKRKTEIIRSWTLPNPKVYENKTGAFITGLDLSDSGLDKKLKKRAERFGIEKQEEPLTTKEVNALYKSLGIDPEKLNSGQLKNIRLEALHVRGVNGMFTHEVIAYFNSYGPASVEWIDDFSCNVLWLDKASPIRALIGLSRPFNNEKKKESFAKEDEVKRSETEDIIVISNSEQGDYNAKGELNDVLEISMEVDSLSDSEKPSDLETKNDSSKVPVDIVDVPVPPGHWRLGIPHPKSRAILLRFATTEDKKLPGAEKRSQFYRKYGNPNYAGLKGLISTSRKRKMQAARNRQVVEKFTEDSTSQSEINSGETSNRKIIRSNRSKMPRMRMYADEEEEKNRKRSCMRYESGRRNVHSRLGTKYTKDELCVLGNTFSSESEEEDDNIPVHCIVPSRYHIWDDIAFSMAEEDNPRARSVSPDSESFKFRKSRKNRTTGDGYSTQSSRPWRPSRNPSSEDPSSLNSNGRQRPQEDLRSKIKRIKKDSVNKHRSPMFMDD